MANKLKSRVGEKYTTNEGYEIEIIEYFNWEKVTIKFNCGYIVKNLQYGTIKRGWVTYPMHRSVYGVGYNGVGNFKVSIGNKPTKTYILWKSMLGRCYSEKGLEKYPTYKDVTVCEEWHNFQNFAKWVEDNYIEGWELDKDLISKGNKIYNPEMCCFIPTIINKTLTKREKERGELPLGVTVNNNNYRVRLSKNGKPNYIGTFNTPEEAFQAYKTAKESYIKELADKYKNQINKNVYNALYKYEVEITD